jgi:ribonucleoside-diphosphate reductase alpha chain
LDDVIDASAFPSEKAATIGRSRRRIGIGVMGLDTALRRLDIAYDSEEAVALSSEIATRLNVKARAESTALALERGTFPDFYKSRLTAPLRNVGLLSIAPTGGISSLWGVSSGIEPLFGATLAKETTTISIDKGSDTLPLLPPCAIHRLWHIRHVAAWQAHVDGGISKTINLPAKINIAEIRKVLIDAWLHATKSVSIFRNGSRIGGIIPL